MAVDSSAVAAGPRQKETRGASRRQRSLFAFGMVTPAVVAVLVILGFPVLYNLYLSITNASALTGLSDPDVVGLRNYETVFRDPRFQRALSLTITWTLANLVLQLGLGLVMAVLIHDTHGRLGSAMRALWVLPWLLPAASAFFVWRLMFSPDVGQLGSLLSVVGVSRNIIGDPGLALWAVIVAGTWKGYPFYMLMFASALTSVSTDLYDAARVDGAGRLRVFWNIELPAIRPVVGLAAILGFVWIFNWMTPLLVMTEGGPGGATTTVGVYIYQEAIRSFRLANAAVASTVLVGVVLIVFAILFVVRRRAGIRSTGVA